jgi:hypothetical protein
LRALEDWAWKQPIPWKHKGVLVALARAYNREGGCFASQPAIGELMGVTARTVRESEKWLTESGFIRRRRRHRANGSRTSDEVSFSSPLQAAESAASLPEESSAWGGGATGRICQNLPEDSSKATGRIFPPIKGKGKREVEKVRKQLLDPDGGGVAPAQAGAREAKEAGDVETNSNDNTPTLPKEEPAWVSAAFAEYPQLVGRDLVWAVSDERLGGEGEIRQRRAILVELLKADDKRLHYSVANRKANATPEDDLPTLPVFLDVAS